MKLSLIVIAYDMAREIPGWLRRGLADNGCDIRIPPITGHQRPGRLEGQVALCEMPVARRCKSVLQLLSCDAPSSFDGLIFRRIR